MDDQKILGNASKGAIIFSDVESVYIKWLKPQTGIFENHEGKYGILYWDEKFKEWDNVGAIYAAKLLCSSRSLADIKELVELRKANAELEKKLTCKFTSYKTEPAESVAGMAIRQLGNESRWVDIAWLNSLKFPDIGPNDYYPVGTILIMPESK